MVLNSLLIATLAFTLCFAANQNVCLYSGPANTVLKPLQLRNADCTKNTSYCMNAIYKYGNFQYNGVAALKPKLGEIIAFLARQEDGSIDYVAMLNANTFITSIATVEITGAQPVDILLKDDPNNGGANTDYWYWDPAQNKGNFSLTTQPGYTDGVVIGHINFIDNYCVTSTFTQGKGALNTTTLLTGTMPTPTRLLSFPYTSGAVWQFCQYPKTNTTTVDATCPGSSDGSATITIVFGPSAVTYKWYNSAGALISSTATATGLSAGTYHAVINDTTLAGCNADRLVVIREHTLNGAFVSTTQYACTTKGTASATPDGGSDGFTFSWFKSGATTPFASGTSVSGLDLGDYFVRVTDSCGSTADTPFTITSVGCCGDGICQTSDGCSCTQDCGTCCPPGTINVDNVCQVCPPGTYSNISQATSCNNCPANTFNNGGNSTCAPCPLNYVSDAGSGVCSRCPPGYVRTATDTACRACGPGAYAPCDASPCVQCPAGTFSSSSGTAICATCPPGTSSTAGKSTCTTCAVGKYSSAGASSCTTCPSGTTTASTGAAHILACQ